MAKIWWQRRFVARVVRKVLIKWQADIEKQPILKSTRAIVPITLLNFVAHNVKDQFFAQKQKCLRGALRQSVTIATMSSSAILGWLWSGINMIKIGRFCKLGDYTLFREGVSIGDICEIQADCEIGEETIIRDFTIICEGVKIGASCKIGPFVLIQPNVVIGDDCRVHSHSFLCEGVKLADRVFIGHGVQFCNEKYPEAVRDEKWSLNDNSWVFVDEDAVIGTGAVILPGVRIGKNARIGAGATVVDSVPDGATVISPKAVLVEERHGNWGKFV